MGGSTNTVLHTLAIAIEAGVPFDLRRLNEVAERVPHICKVSPAGHHHMEDVDRAGGISAILKTIGAEARRRCTSICITVTGKTLGENIADAPRSTDADVIRPLDNAYRANGGLAVLFGNLAPEGAVVKAGGVAPEMMQFTGPAVIFESQEDAYAGILGGKVKAGDVVVIRYEGPRAAPACRRCSPPPPPSSAAASAKSVALITDGRFSGGDAAAACIGHVSPEAAAGGPIALVRRRPHPDRHREATAGGEPQ